MQVSTPQSRRNLGAIAWMVAAVAVLSLMDAAMKWLSPHYPALQVAAMRGMASFPVVVLWLAVRGELRQVVRVRWVLQLLRAAMAVLMLTCFVYAVRALPLADAYSIFFVSPLLITALSVPLLGEHVDARRWAAIAVGLLGVLVVLRPTGAGALTLAGLAALLAAVCYSLSAITMRVLGRTDTTGSMMFWFTAIVALGAGALAAPHWVALRPEHRPVLAVVALTGALGQYAVTEAFKSGEASVVAPFEYSAIAMGVSLDWVIWSTRPQARMLAGASIVIAAGLYLIHRERSRPRLEAEHP